MAFLDDLNALFGGGFLGQQLLPPDTIDELSARSKLQGPVGLPQPPQAPSPQMQVPTNRPSPVTLPSQAQPDVPTLDRVRAMFGNLGAGIQGQGLIPGLMDAISGAQTGVRTDPQGVAQQNLVSTYNALRASGVPEPIARAGTLNPEILKTIAPAYFDTAPKLQETGTNPLTGQKNFAIYKPNTQTLTAAPVTPRGGGAPQLSAVDQALNSGVQGEDFLKIMAADPNYGVKEVNVIKKMISGDLPPPSSFALSKPEWATRIALATAVDPNFSEATWTARTAMARNASSGQVAQSNNALNTGIGHITQLADAVANLGNTNYPVANWVKNIVSTNIGNTAVTNFEAIKNRVAPEITRIWRGAGGAEADIKRDIDNISTANSPAQLYGAISQIAGLMESKIQANQKQYSDAMGPSGRNPDFMISPENRTALDRIRGLASGGAQAAQSGAPQVGEVRKGYKFLGGDPSLQSSWQKQ